MKIRFSLILLFNSAGLTLFLSWFLPNNHGFWFLIDSKIFYFFNQNLVENYIYLWLIAVFNNRIFDGFLLIVTVYITFLFWQKRNNIEYRKIILIGLTMLITAIILNNLSQVLIPIKRASPTLFFSDINRVSNILNISTKDASKNSFPGNHGVLLFTFSAFMLRYFGRKAFIISIILVIIFLFPRVIIGAHWFTDIFVGSLSVVLIGLPWFLITSLSDYIIMLFDRCLPDKI